jgi:stress response protein SCP2
MEIQVKKGSGLMVSAKKLNKGIIAGIYWDPSPDYSVDCDLFCVATTYNSINNTYYLNDMSALLYHSNLKCFNGMLSHSGDEQKGAKEGPDETITAFLNKLPETITDVIIGACIDPIKSTPGSTFKHARNAKVRISELVENASAPTEIYSLDLQTEDTTGMLIGMYSKVNGDWFFEKINKAVKCVTQTPIQEVLEVVPCDCL